LIVVYFISTTAGRGVITSKPLGIQSEPAEAVAKFVAHRSTNAPHRGLQHKPWPKDSPARPTLTSCTRSILKKRHYIQKTHKFSHIGDRMVAEAVLNEPVSAIRAVEFRHLQGKYTEISCFRRLELVAVGGNLSISRRTDELGLRFNSEFGISDQGIHVLEGGKSEPF
jgi:hypothetical protein